jgi:hypothetical protein
MYEGSPWGCRGLLNYGPAARHLDLLVAFYTDRAKNKWKNKIKPDMVLHSCNPSSQETKARGLWVQDQPRLWWVWGEPGLPKENRSQKANQTKE